MADKIWGVVSVGCILYLTIIAFSFQHRNAMIVSGGPFTLGDSNYRCKGIK